MRRATHATALRTAIVLLVALFAVIAPASAGSQDAPHTGHSMAWGRETFLLLDRAELRLDDGIHPPIELKGWHGGAVHRLWFGAAIANDRGTGAHLDLAYGRLVAPYWDLQVGGWLETGLEFDAIDREDLGASVGVHGLAPGWFEVEAAVRVSGGGHLSAHLSGAYDLYLTQRFVVDPYVELEWHPQPLAERGIAAGLSSLGYGARMRYEVSRRLAPYVAVRFSRDRIEFTPPSVVSDDRMLVVGIRAWR